MYSNSTKEEVERGRKGQQKQPEKRGTLIKMAEPQRKEAWDNKSFDQENSNRFHDTKQQAFSI